MHAGTPNTPSITSLSLMENDITIDWMIDIHELRPVDKYLIQVQITGSNDKESNSGSEFLTSGDDQVAGANGASFGGSSRPFEGQAFNITISESVDDLTCSVNARGDINDCEYTLIQEAEIGQIYSFIVCAVNNFGTACGDSRNITATPPAVTTVTSSSAPPLVIQVSTTVTPPQPTSTTLTPQDVTNSQTVTIVPHGTLTTTTTTTNAQLLATPLPPPRSGPKTPTGLEGVFVGITFGVVVVVLLCCVLCVSVFLLCVCCCLRREREKNYWPEEIG